MFMQLPAKEKGKNRENVCRQIGLSAVITHIFEAILNSKYDIPAFSSDFWNINIAQQSDKTLETFPYFQMMVPLQAHIYSSHGQDAAVYICQLSLILPVVNLCICSNFIFFILSVLQSFPISHGHFFFIIKDKLSPNDFFHSLCFSFIYDFAVLGIWDLSLPGAGFPVRDFI